MGGVCGLIRYHAGNLTKSVYALKLHLRNVMEYKQVLHGGRKLVL